MIHHDSNTILNGKVPLGLHHSEWPETDFPGAVEHTYPEATQYCEPTAPTPIVQCEPPSIG